jgi:NMD protein affecting ribosome stability and mRNA decay
MEIVCYRCGASSKDKKFIDYLCIDCFINEKKAKIPDEISIKECKVCGKIKVKSWTKDKKKIKEELMEKFSKYNPIDLVIDDEIRFTFFDKVRFEKSIRIKWEQSLCDVCSKIKRKYYEAIIQIRKKEEIEKERKEDVEKRLEEAKNRVIEILKHKTFVTKVEKLKFGYDIYVGSAKDIFPLISTLGPVKITRKLYGEVAGRKVYRTTFLLRV